MSLALETRTSGIGKAFVATAIRVLTAYHHSTGAVDKILNAYGLTESVVSNISDQDSLLKILEFGHDIGFLAPSVALARNWAAKGNSTYVYRFNETNPWDGPWKGYSTHVLDVAFLFLNYLDKLTEPQVKVAEAFADDFIRFVNGKVPWTPLDMAHEGVRVYGPSSEGIESKYVKGLHGGDTGRRSTLFEMSESTGISLDHFAAVWNTFLSGK